MRNYHKVEEIKEEFPEPKTIRQYEKPIGPERDTPKAIKQYDEPIGPSRKPRSLGETTSDIFSDENILATGRHVASKVPGVIRNIGTSVMGLSQSMSEPPQLPGTGKQKKGRSSGRVSAPALPPGLLMSPGWTRGNPIPSQFLRIPYVATIAPASRTPKKKSKRNPPVAVSTRPEWIRF